MKADLDRARAKHGLRTDELAVLLGIHPGRLLRIERGAEQPPPGLHSRLRELVEASDLSKLKVESASGGSIHTPWARMAGYLAFALVGTALYFIGDRIQSFSLQISGALLSLFCILKGRTLWSVCSACGARVADHAEGICRHCGVSFRPGLPSGESNNSHRVRDGGAP